MRSDTTAWQLKGGDLRAEGSNGGALHGGSLGGDRPVWPPVASALRIRSREDHEGGFHRSGDKKKSRISVGMEISTFRSWVRT